MFKSLIFMVLVAFGFVANAQTTAARQKHFLIEKGVALQGYDPVSYSTGKPVAGKAALQHAHNGVTYRFANQQNLDAFKAAPDKYEPAFGGWCAYAIGKDGSKVVPNPLNYKVVEGKVYLFYDDWITDTKKEWNKNEAGLNAKAKQQWSAIIAK